MDSIQQTVVQEIISIFTKSFISQFTREIIKLKRYKIKTVDVLPQILLGEYGIDAIFSVDKGHFMLNFTYNNIGTIKIRYIYGDVIVDEAILRANMVASLTTEKVGAQDGMPTYEKVEERLKRKLKNTVE